MSNRLSSRERLTLAIDHQEPDHVPLLFANWPYPLAPASSFTKFREVDYLLGLGLDAAIGFDPPIFFPHAVRPLSPGMQTRVWKEVLPGEDYPLLSKEYETVRGTLRQVVRQTADWPHGDDIPLFTDFVPPTTTRRSYTACWT